LISSLNSDFITYTTNITYNQSSLKKASDISNFADSALKGTSLNNHSADSNVSGSFSRQSTVGTALWKLITSDSINRFKPFDSKSNAKFFLTPNRDIADVYWRNRILLKHVGWGSPGFNNVPQEQKLIVFDIPKHVLFTDFKTQAADVVAPVAAAPTARTRSAKRTLPSQEQNTSFSFVSSRR